MRRVPFTFPTPAGPVRLRLALAVALACGSVPLTAVASEAAVAPAAAKSGKAAAAAGATAVPSTSSTTTAAPSTAPAASADPAAPAAAAGNDLDLLRERLAEKLGAMKPPQSPLPNLLRVTTRPDAPAAERPSRSSAAAAPRAPSAAVVAAVEPSRAAKASGPVPPPGSAWAYAGVAGPAAWGAIRPEFKLCGNGQRQSPIDIRDGIAVELETVQFDYRASDFKVIDNGHTVQVNIGNGNSIQVGGRRYELVQFHFHRPAEERINGRSFDMSLHLVHQDAEGRRAVVGLLLERGAPQPVVQTVWNNLPLEKSIEQAGLNPMDLMQLLPSDRGYYTYMGSMTTPPCDEGVLWMVMRQPVTVSQSQLDIFARLYPMNARPLQSAAGRLIKQSE